MIEKERIYLDYAATTPVDDRVVAAMLPYFNQTFGNPSSVHFWGQQAETAVERAREQVAQVIHAEPSEVVFTSCGTESDNLSLRGTALARRKQSGCNHILISPVEHHAVLSTAEQLGEELGFEIELLPADEYGRVDPAEVARRVRVETAVVSVIYANNEIGTINPIEAIGRICHERGVPFHTDAVQAAAHLRMDVQADAVDLLAIGAHKFYGPKGVGALFIRKGSSILPVQTGGKQEAGMRAGTHNVPLVVGLSEALRLTAIGLEERGERLKWLRDQLIAGVLTDVPGAHLTGHPNSRLPNHASFVFEGVDGNLLLMMLDMHGFACSSGSACKAGNPKPSDVLLAIGLDVDLALGSLRVTLGRGTTEEQIDRFLQVLPNLVKQNRANRTKGAG